MRKSQAWLGLAGVLVAAGVMIAVGSVVLRLRGVGATAASSRAAAGDSLWDSTDLLLAGILVAFAVGIMLAGRLLPRRQGAKKTESR